MNRKLYTILVALGLVALLFLWMTLDRGGKVDKPVQRLAVATTSSGALVHIAQELGYFQEQGLAVEIKNFSSGKKAAHALLNKEVDIATTADAAFVELSFKEKELRIFGTVAAVNASSFIALKSKGINELTDLPGKKIGVTFKTTGEYFLRTFLLDNQIADQDVIMVNLSAPEIVEAMKQGKIDACHTWQPYVYYISTALGAADIRQWPGQGDEDYHFLLLAQNPWLEAHPDSVRGFLTALVKAEAYVSQHPTEAEQKYIGLVNIDKAAAQVKWQGIKPTIELSQSLVSVLEAQARYNISKKYTDVYSVPNYLDFLYLDALKEVKPEAVTLY